MSKKYSEKLVEVNQWKYTEKAGDKADRVILNPYDTKETKPVVEIKETKPVVEIKETKPVVEIKETKQNLSSESELDEEEFEEDDFVIYGGEEFSHYEYTGISLIKAPNGQVWNKDEKNALVITMKKMDK